MYENWSEWNWSEWDTLLTEVVYTLSGPATSKEEL